MKRGRLGRLLLGGVVAFVALIGAYVLVVRPWHLTWGATDEEVRRPMSGDGIHADPSFTGSTTTGSPARITSSPSIRA